MKCKILVAIAFFYSTQSISQVGIGTTNPNTSAALDITATDKGLLPPRMTSAQRDAIVSPAAGLMIFNTTNSCVEIYRGTGWFNICSSIYMSSPFVKLLGGNQSDIPYSIQQTTDGGYIIAGSSQTSNNGTLTGISSNGSIDCWVIKLTSTGTVAWQKLLGGTGIDVGYSLILTTDGGYMIAGASSSTNSGTMTGLTNNGSDDLWMCKLDGAGNISWQQLYGGPGAESAASIVETNDGGYIITGSSTSSNAGTLTGLTSNGSNEVWVIKTNATGTIVWQKLFGGSGLEIGTGVHENTDGSYVVSAYSNSSNTGTLTGFTNNGFNDALIIKLNSTGTIVWQKLLGGSGFDVANNIMQTVDNGYIVTGNSSSSNTGTLTGVTSNGFSDAWVLKLDASGNTTWQKLLGGTQNEQSSFIRQTTDGGYVFISNAQSSNTGTLTGLTNNGGTWDVWVVKLTSTGTVSWQKLLGGSGVDIPYCIRQVADGGYIVAASSTSSNSGTLTGFVNPGLEGYLILKLDANGNPL